MDPSTVVQVAARGWPSEVPPNAVATPVAAGRLSTAPLWRIDASDRSYALRGWRHDQRPQAELAARFLYSVYDPNSLPVPVPVPVLSNANERLLATADSWWELSPWLSGSPCDSPELTDKQFESACRALGRLHVRAAKLSPNHCETSAASHLRQVDDLQQQLTAGAFAACDPTSIGMWWPPSWPPPTKVLAHGLEIVSGRLASLEQQPLTAQLVWGDAWINNFLFDHEEVVGMVDFATVRVDTPMADLARLLGSVTNPAHDRWQLGVDAYASTRSTTAVDRSAAIVLHDSGTVLSFANWLRWLAVEHREFPSQQAAVSRAAHFAQRLARLVGLPACG